LHIKSFQLDPKLGIALSKLAYSYKVEWTFDSYDKSRMSCRKTHQWILCAFKERDDGLYDSNISVYKVLVTMPTVYRLARRRQYQVMLEF
jgi:hypothetical protein